ncbi:hypothetical protein [Nocardia sp. IFM 10818]
MAIGAQPRAAGKNFNIVPSQDRIVTLRGFFELLEQYFGYRFQVLPFTDWVDLWKDDPMAPLYPLRSMYCDRVLDGKCTVELYQNTYRWGTRNVAEHLRGTGVEEPALTKEILARYLHRVLAEPHVPRGRWIPDGLEPGAAARPASGRASDPAAPGFDR